MKKYHKRILYFIPLILFGGFIFVYGGYDDSPGAQLLGLALVIFGIVALIKRRNKQKLENS